MDRGIETFIQIGKQSLRRFDSATVELTRRGGFFVLPCKVVVPMLLALVDDEPAGEALDLPPVDEVMERELMDEKRWHRQWPAPGEPPATSRGVTDSHTYRINRGATSVSGLAGEKTDMESRSHVQPGTPVIQCDCCFLKTEEYRHSVQTKQMVAIPLEKKSDRDPLASRSLAAFARHVGHPIVINHPRRLGARTHGSRSRCTRTVDIRNTSNLTRKQQRLQWSSRQGSPIR